MSSANNSSVPSGMSNRQKPTTGRRTFSELIKNDSSINVGSNALSSVSDSIRSSPQYSYSSPVLLIPLALNHNSYPISSAGVFHNGLTSSSLCLPNEGQKPYYNEEINNVNLSGGDNRNQVGYGFQDRSHEQWSYSYQGPSGCMIQYMSFPKEQSQTYNIPTIFPSMYPMYISNVVPSNWYNAYEVPNVIPFYPLDAYNNLIHPQYNYFYVPTYYIPYKAFYASLQSNFSFLSVNLRAKLRKQIEYYFSLENLPSDCYLKKHMDDQGWVPITLIAQFRRVQQLMNERQFIYDSFRIWSFMEVQVKPLADTIQFILDSLRHSYDVEVRGNKVRKRHEWKKCISHI